MSAIDGLYSRVGSETRSVDCCDTTFEIHADGFGAGRGVAAAIETARNLESQLDAFDEASDVTTLARTGEVTNPHIAAIVRRGLAYESQTDGIFSIRYGRTERTVKSYIRDGGDVATTVAEPANVDVSGERVRSSAPLDLNGIAKGFIVDRSHATLDRPGRNGYVNGGGDIAGRIDGGIAIESPWGGDPLRVVDTDWSIATSGSYRRNRGGVDHIYRPDDGSVGAQNTIVTVVARRDTTEADVLATTCAALPPDSAIDLIDGWAGAEVFLVHDGVFHETEGFDAHLA